DWKCHPCPSSRERFLTCHDLSIVAHSSTRALPVVPCDNVHADETPATIAVRCVVRIFLRVAQDDAPLPRLHVKGLLAHRSPANLFTTTSRCAQWSSVIT